MNYPQLNYIKQIKGYWIAHNAHSLGVEEAGLYFHLLEISNTLRWMNPFKRNNSKVMSDLGIKDRRTLDRYRLRLKQAGIIDFKTKNGDGNTTYIIIDLSIFCTGFSIGDGIGSGTGYGIGYSTGDGTDNINKGKLSSIPDSNESGGDDRPAREPDNNFKKKKKVAAEKNPIYVECMNWYNPFVMKWTDCGAKMDKVQGRALNEIIEYLKTQVRNKKPGITDTEMPVYVVNSFRTILDNWNFLTPHLKGRTKLSDINSEMQNILTHIKNGLTNSKGNGSTGGTGGAFSTVRKGGATVGDFESLKYSGEPGDKEPTEFTNPWMAEPEEGA